MSAVDEAREALFTKQPLILLMKDDLDALIAAVRAETLVQVEAFLWGQMKSHGWRLTDGTSDLPPNVLRAALERKP